METNKFFLYLNRINSVLFLIALIVILGLVGYFYLDSNSYQDRRSVKVGVTDKDSDKKEKIEISRVDTVTGHDVQIASA